MNIVVGIHALDGRESTHRVAGLLRERMASGDTHFILLCENFVEFEQFQLLQRKYFPNDASKLHAIMPSGNIRSFGSYRKEFLESLKSIAAQRKSGEHVMVESFGGAANDCYHALNGSVHRQMRRTFGDETKHA
ncbi:MAG: hypothetical protein NUV67_03195, partial [archaeon]|nr:hypothetical protein [archaeon]